MAVGPQIDVDDPAVAAADPEVTLLFPVVVVDESNGSEVLDADVRVANAVVGESVAFKDVVLLRSAIEVLDISVKLALVVVVIKVEFIPPVPSRGDVKLRNSVVEAFSDCEDPTEPEDVSVLFKLPVLVIEFVVVVVGSRLCVMAHVVYKAVVTVVSITSVVLALPDP